MNKKNEIAKLNLKINQVTKTESILNADQIQKLFNSTPQRWTYSRPAKGGGQWKFVKVSYVRKNLDSITGYNWDFDIETTVAEAFEVAKLTKSCVVKGILTCRTRKDGEWHTIKKTQFGRAEVKFKKGTQDPLDFGNDMKAAASDALKKCASLLGIAADIYEADEFMEINIVEADNSDQTAAIDRQVKKAKEQLKAESEEVDG